MADRRELQRIVFRRKHIRWDVVFGKAQGDGYGHWWVMIDQDESYGWWPAQKLRGIPATIIGVPGVLNANSQDWTEAKEKQRLSSEQDLHHYDETGLEEFHPVVDDDRSADQVIEEVREFVREYPKTRWAFPALAKDAANCHTFQDEMLTHCRLEMGTVRVIDDNGNPVSERPRKAARPNDD